MATSHERARTWSAPGRTYHEDDPPLRYVWATTRILLSFIFLWAFLDKLLGLGRATPAERAWLNGGSPTRGFLANTEGPFAGMFQAMAGNVLVDGLFMLGLLGIGLSLLLGIGLRVMALAGALLMVLMWLASLPLDNNLWVDDHLIYALVMVGLALERAGETWGVQRWWRATPLVRRAPWLE